MLLPHDWVFFALGIVLSIVATILSWNGFWYRIGNEPTPGQAAFSIRMGDKELRRGKDYIDGVERRKKKTAPLIIASLVLFLFYFISQNV